METLLVALVRLLSPPSPSRKTAALFCFTIQVARLTAPNDLIRYLPTLRMWFSRLAQCPEDNDRSKPNSGFFPVTWVHGAFFEDLAGSGRRMVLIWSLDDVTLPVISARGQLAESTGVW